MQLMNESSSTECINTPPDLKSLSLILQQLLQLQHDGMQHHANPMVDPSAVRWHIERERECAQRLYSPKLCCNCASVDCSSYQSFNNSTEPNSYASQKRKSCCAQSLQHQMSLD
jgi:hypothetical protein